MTALPTPTALVLALALMPWAGLPAAAEETSPPETTASAPAAESASTEPASTEPASTEAASAEATAEADPGPDAEGWYTNRETGQRYKIERIPKIPYTYHVVDEKTVMLPYGTRFEYVKQDDEAFWVKAYETSLTLAKRIEASKPQPKTPEQLAAEYPAELPTEKTLDLVAFDSGLPRAGQWRNGFSLADMNGDGRLDIVFGPARKATRVPSIFLNDGQGGWTAWRTDFPPDAYDYGSAVAADFDGDGHVDLALGIHLRGMLVLRGDGQGGFTPWSEGIPLDRGGNEPAYASKAFLAADWNGDGKLDLVTLGEGPSRSRTAGDTGLGIPVDASRGILVYLNHGDGSWEAYRPEALDRKTADFGDDLAAGDLDGDGFLDLVLASGRRGNPFLVRKGSASHEVTTLALQGMRPNSGIDAVATGDLDGDGRTDLVASYRVREQDGWRNGVDVFYQTADHQLRRVGVFSAVMREGITALATGDLDGDGRLDVVAGTGKGLIWPILATDKGFALDGRPELEAYEGCAVFDVHVADLDGDGRGDVVAGFAGEPTGLTGLEGLSQTGCPNQGSLRAWASRPRAKG